MNAGWSLHAVDPSEAFFGKWLNPFTFLVFHQTSPEKKASCFDNNEDYIVNSFYFTGDKNCDIFTRLTASRFSSVPLIIIILTRPSKLILSNVGHHMNWIHANWDHIRIIAMYLVGADPCWWNKRTIDWMLTTSCVVLFGKTSCVRTGAGLSTFGRIKFWSISLLHSVLQRRIIFVHLNEFLNQEAAISLRIALVAANSPVYWCTLIAETTESITVDRSRNPRAKSLIALHQ